MKKFLNVVLFVCLSVFAYSQVQDTIGPDIKETSEEVIEVLTGDEVTIDVPPTFDPFNPAVVMEWWVFIYGLLSPIGLYLLFQFWPGLNRKDLIIKSISVGVIAITLVVVARGQGADFQTIASAVFALVLQTGSYRSMYKPLGLKSKKKES